MLARLLAVANFSGHCFSHFDDKNLQKRCSWEDKHERSSSSQFGDSREIRDFRI